MSTIHDIHTDNLVVRTCWCGVRHAIPSNLDATIRKSKSNGAYCPLGHQYFHAGETTEQQLQRERAAADQRLAAMRDRVDRANRERDTAENRRRAEKAAKTRLKNRVDAGVCPCCNRTFQNLARHMKGQHPDFSHQD